MLGAGGFRGRDMRSKIIMLATAAALVVAPVFAQEGAMNLKEGEAMMVTPQGAMQKSTKMIDDARHEAALKQGAKEVAEGTVFYRHGGKLYNVTCRGPYIGGWKE